MKLARALITIATLIVAASCEVPPQDPASPAPSSGGGSCQGICIAYGAAYQPCGNDGCGGSCGTCGMAKTCDDFNQVCMDQKCTTDSDCVSGACGPATTTTAMITPDLTEPEPPYICKVDDCGINDGCSRGQCDASTCHVCNATGACFCGQRCTSDTDCAVNAVAKHCTTAANLSATACPGVSVCLP